MGLTGRPGGGECGDEGHGRRRGAGTWGHGSSRGRWDRRLPCSAFLVPTLTTNPLGSPGRPSWKGCAGVSTCVHRMSVSTHMHCVCLHVCISRPGVGGFGNTPGVFVTELPSVSSVGLVCLPVALLLGAVYVPYGVFTPEGCFLGVVQAIIAVLWDV